MKTGVIVYVAGEGIDPAANVETAVRSLDIPADRIEWVSSDSGHFDVADAWLSLTLNGMHRIICMIAEMTGTGSLRLTGRELRLCG